jgi:hypothetical protein
MANYLVKKVNDKRWIWFKNTNNYLQMEEALFQIFNQLETGKTNAEILSFCQKAYQITEKEAQDTLENILRLRKGQMDTKPSAEEDSQTINPSLPNSFFSSKTYFFNGHYFRFDYGDAEIETMFHPLFAHLEKASAQAKLTQIKLFSKNKRYYLVQEQKLINSWAWKEDHIFKGQLFMALLNQAHSKTEEDWMGVLHASAIGHQENSLLFLGDSGNGKSTASAIALASGLALLADDFVPLDQSASVLAFPAAISVKKNAIELLSKDFPELLKAKEYELKAMNKTVRYLSPKVDKSAGKPKKVKALIFIEYTKEISFELSEMDKHLAFQKLVVDAWLSPEEENAQRFLDWMADIPSYRIRYSDNAKMIKHIKALLDKSEN